MRGKERERQREAEIEGDREKEKEIEKGGGRDRENESKRTREHERERKSERARKRTLDLKKLSRARQREIFTYCIGFTYYFSGRSARAEKRGGASRLSEILAWSYELFIFFRRARRLARDGTLFSIIVKGYNPTDISLNRETAE